MSESSGSPTPGGEHGAKTSDVKQGGGGLPAVKPSAPKQPVRH